MTAKDIRPQTVRAHELYGDFWFNSEPVPISALRGQVILIQFWDYTCVHCQRTLPYIKEWYKKYEKYGLVVVGVHTPKFPFGKNPEDLQKAIRRLDITYPVVADNEYMIATHYGNRFWPALYLIDKNGFIRYENAGEGNYAATEHAIQALLYDAGVGEELPLVMEPIREEDKPGAVCFRVTPELFAGYLRGSIGNVEGYSPESVVAYKDPGMYLQGRFYANGNWMNDKSCLTLEEGGEQAGEIILQYEALAVNAVFTPGEGEPCEVVIHQDEQFLTHENRGEDVLLSPEGRSYLRVDEPRMYRLVRNREYAEHTLKVSTTSKGFALYSFMFVTCVIPESVSNN